MSTATIKAIETSYKGYRFRSRLEARWAVYFDAIGIEWEYESEGFDLGDGVYYLPDFWLPQVRMWAEVKPEEFGAEEEDKARRLASQSGHDVIKLIGTPSPIAYWVVAGTPPDMDEPDASPDYDVILGTEYLHSENRFYACTPYERGEEFPEDSYYYRDIYRAVRAARSARFDRREASS